MDNNLDNNLDNNQGGQASPQILATLSSVHSADICRTKLYIFTI